MVGMVAVAAVAAMPSLTNALSTVFSKIGFDRYRPGALNRNRGAGAKAIRTAPSRLPGSVYYRQCSVVYARCRHGVHQNQPCSVLH